MRSETVSGENPEQINAQAAEWLARRDAPDWSDADRVQLERWMQASFRHRVAYLRLELVWKKTGRLKALGAGYASGEIPPPGQWHRSPFAETLDVTKATPAAHKDSGRRRGTNRSWRRPMLLAGVLSALLACAMWYAAPHGSKYQTPIGAVETVAISDGSHVTLNTDTEIRVALGEGERRIQLDRGEAYFEVAKDAHRPFVVRAGTVSVTAVGTQFSVRRQGLDTLVVVTEGVVRVQGYGAASSAKPQAVTAGQSARVTEAGVLVQDEPAPKMEEQLSWRTGLLVFRDTRLEHAVAEFNRYNARKILIADPALKDLRVAGSFKATSTDAFVHLLEQGFPLRVEERDGSLILQSN
jgi:transmembrane sensor